MEVTSSYITEEMGTLRARHNKRYTTGAQQTNILTLLARWKPKKGQYIGRGVLQYGDGFTGSLAKCYSLSIVG